MKRGGSHWQDSARNFQAARIIVLTTFDGDEDI